MRKSGILILLLWAVVQCSIAAVVTQESAARYAGIFMGMNSIPVAENFAMQRSASRGGIQEPEYYVYNNPDGGWVIIAADDRITPVLAYSDNGRFEIDADMPDNLTAWMNDLAQTIDLVRGSDEVPSEQVTSAWSVLRSLGTNPESSKKIIKTAVWDQNDPYNIYCPIVTGETQPSAAGCVATAMAIAMRHNNWPNKGKGVIGGYRTASRFYYISSYSIDDRVYDWSKMPLTDGAQEEWTSDQEQQVAQLMYDCGVMVKMDYTGMESSASFFKIPEAMKEYMSYSDKVLEIHRSSYTIEKWYSIIKDEIDADRVVIYSGNEESAIGHAMICDGYDTDGSKLHINWGWGGRCNGFYTLDLTVTLNKRKYSFGFDQAAIIGIAPDTSYVSHNEKSQLVHYIIASKGVYGLSPDGIGDLIKGTRLQFMVGGFVNNSNESVYKKFKVCLMDSSGTIVRQDGWFHNFSIPSVDGKVYSRNTEISKLTVTPELTDYFKLFYEEGSEWAPVNHNHDLFPDADGICCGVTPDPIIILPEECSAGQKIDLKLTYGYIPVKTVSWHVNEREYDTSTLVLGAGKTVIKAYVTYYDDSEGTITATVYAK